MYRLPSTSLTFLFVLSVIASGCRKKSRKILFFILNKRKSKTSNIRNCSLWKFHNWKNICGFVAVPFALHSLASDGAEHNDKSGTLRTNMTGQFGKDIKSERSMNNEDDAADSIFFEPKYKSKLYQSIRHKKKKPKNSESNARNR